MFITGDNPHITRRFCRDELGPTQILKVINNLFIYDQVITIKSTTKSLIIGIKPTNLIIEIIIQQTII